MKKYFNTISSFQFYQLLRYATFILIGIIFTKTALSQTDIGEYETFVFIAGAITFFWLNGLIKALLPISNNKNSGSNIFSAFIVIQVFSVLAAFFLYLLKSQFSDYLLDGREIPELNLVLLFIVFNVPASLVEYIYLIRKKNKHIIFYGIISFTIQFILVVLPPLLGYGIEKSIQGMVVSSILKYAWLWITFISLKDFTISLKFISEYLRIGAPLVIATFLSGSAQYVDGFIVTSKFDEETFAVFRYGARELPLAMILANALSSAMLPEFANQSNIQNTLEQLKMSITRLMKYLFPVTAVLLLISYPLFPIVFNPSFAESATIFNIYLLLIISRMLLPQTILNGLKSGRPIMAASFFELCVNVSLSLILVQFLGIAGIAFATFIAYLFEKIYLVIAVKKKFNVHISAYVPVKLYILFSIGILVIFLIAETVIK